MADCAERLLQTAAQLGLHMRVQCLEYLGVLFRGTIEAPAQLTDLQVRLRRQRSQVVQNGRVLT